MAVVLGLAGVFAKAAILPSAEPSPAATRSTPTIPLPTSSTPSPTPAETSSRSRLVLRGAGDVNLDSNFIPNFRTFGYDYAWSGLKGFFKRDDLTVVNLECPVSRLGSQVLTKDYHFRADPNAFVHPPENAPQWGLPHVWGTEDEPPAVRDGSAAPGWRHSRNLGRWPVGLSG